MDVQVQSVKSAPQPRDRLQLSHVRSKRTSGMSLESGYESNQTSKVELSAMNGRKEENVLADNLITIGEELAFPSDFSPTTAEVSIIISETSSLQNLKIRRESDLSDHSCSQSDASTPGSTEPLIPDNSRSTYASDFNSEPSQKHFLEVPKTRAYSAKSETSDTLSLTYSEEVILRNTVRSNMTIFVTCTDFKTLYSHLYEKKILHSTDYATLTSKPSGRERGNHFYMEILPRKGRNVYRCLYNCLKNETEHLGHLELFNILDSALKDQEASKCNEDFSSTEDETVQIPQQTKSSDSTHTRCKVCCTVQ